MVTYGIWDKIHLFCGEHGVKLTPPGPHSASYTCPKKHEKEMCKLSVSVDIYEKLLYKISELVSEQEKSSMIAPIIEDGIKIGSYVINVKETDPTGYMSRGNFNAYVFDKRFLKKSEK